MALSTMAAVILLIMLAFGLVPASLKSLGIRRFYCLAFLILAPLLRIAIIDFSPECRIGAGCVFVTAAASALSARSWKHVYIPIILSAALAVPAAMIASLFKNDAAVLICAFLPVIALFILKSESDAILTSSLIPFFAALEATLYALIRTGYGVFDLSSSALDLQLMGILAVTAAFELKNSDVKKEYSIDTGRL